MKARTDLRRLLTADALTTVPAIGERAELDPIFKLIAAHKAAWAQFMELDDRDHETFERGRTRRGRRDGRANENTADDARRHASDYRRVGQRQRLLLPADAPALAAAGGLSRSPSKARGRLSGRALLLGAGQPR
jgi:hypothetical protein